MNKQDVITLMESSKSPAEWNANCDKVKKACNGYPPFWYGAIIASGLAERVTNSYGSTAEMEVITVSRRPYTGVYDRPTAMPALADGEILIGIYDQGFGKKEQVCRTLADMQALFDAYASGMTLTLQWTIEGYSKVS
jgi:hypothetical protein